MIAQAKMMTDAAIMMIRTILKILSALIYASIDEDSPEPLPLRGSTG